jgi:hypothetical protein
MAELPKQLSSLLLAMHCWKGAFVSFLCSPVLIVQILLVVILPIYQS